MARDVAPREEAGRGGGAPALAEPPAPGRQTLTEMQPDAGPAAAQAGGTNLAGGSDTALPRLQLGGPGPGAGACGGGFFSGAGVQLNIEEDRGVTADVRRNNVGGRVRVGGPIGPLAGVYFDAAVRWTFGAGMHDGGPIVRGNLLQFMGGVGVYTPPVPFTAGIPASLRVPHVYFGAQLQMGAHFEAHRGPHGLTFDVGEVPVDGTLVLGIRVPQIDFDLCWTIGRMNLLNIGGLRWVDNQFESGGSYVRLGDDVEAFLREGTEVLERVQSQAERFANMIRAFSGGLGASRRQLDTVPQGRRSERGADTDVQIKVFDVERGARTADPRDNDYANPDAIASVQRSMLPRFPFGTRVTLSRGDVHIPLTVHEVHGDPSVTFNVSRNNFDRLGAAAEPRFSASDGVSPRDVSARIG